MELLYSGTLREESSSLIYPLAPFAHRPICLLSPSGIPHLSTLLSATQATASWTHEIVYSVKQARHEFLTSSLCLHYFPAGLSIISPLENSDRGVRSMKASKNVNKSRRRLQNKAWQKKKKNLLGPTRGRVYHASMPCFIIAWHLWILNVCVSQSVITPCRSPCENAVWFITRLYHSGAFR